MIAYIEKEGYSEQIGIRHTPNDETCLMEITQEGTSYEDYRTDDGELVETVSNAITLSVAQAMQLQYALAHILNKLLDAEEEHNEIVVRNFAIELDEEFKF